MHALLTHAAHMHLGFDPCSITISWRIVAALKATPKTEDLVVFDLKLEAKGAKIANASYKRILLCYDGSLEGRKALHCGADLALGLEADAHLLAVVDMQSTVAQSAGMVVDFSGAFETTARAILQEGVDCLIKRGLNAKGHFAIGYPVDEIAARASELKVDLVVVGHRCRTRLSRWWMGAGNTALLDRLSCSILVACDSPDSK
jgi:nucleotide-binding universal stress UspA family protein